MLEMLNLLSDLLCLISYSYSHVNSELLWKDLIQSGHNCIWMKSIQK